MEAEDAVKIAMAESMANGGSLVTLPVKPIDYQTYIAAARYNWRGDIDYHRDLDNQTVGDHVLIWGWNDQTPIDSNAFQLRLIDATIQPSS